MVCKDTLRIKHLPKELTDVQKEQFIRHFGAIKVKVITSKAKATSVIYAKFENEEIAKNLLFRLHQISILNCRLSVEYADHDILQGQLSTQKVDVREGPDKRFFKNFINHVNAFNDSVGFHQPPPSHLKYNYPKANRPTINNIAHALATVPRFYTQVLHLMNKMNLPPPFAMPEPPMHSIPISPFATQTQRTNQIGQKRKNPSSSESELESDGEGGNPSEIIPEKRMLTQKKPLKRAKFITQEVARGSAPSKPVEKVEEVFEKVEVQPQKKIELKVTQELVVETPTLKSPECTVVSKETSISPAAKPASPCIEATPKDLKTSLEKVSRPCTPLEANIEIDQLEAEIELIQPSSDFERQPSLPEDLQQELISEAQKEPNISSESELKLQPPEIYCEGNSKDNALEPPSQQSVVEIVQNQSQPSNEVPIATHEKEPEKVPVGSMSPDDEFPCISLDELRANQLTDLTVVPAFKNYNPGEPTNKVYIKNCAKSVVSQDLEYIFNRYREEGHHGKPSEFNIRLMQEGRMKGQAFVTLDSVEQAQKAVNETNGFILKDRPLVVVFGKAGKKK
ncbi:hypothetical protein HUJ04_008836 [Dendroctonus ponderosae]